MPFLAAFEIAASLALSASGKPAGASVTPGVDAWEINVFVEASYNFAFTVTPPWDEIGKPIIFTDTCVYSEVTISR